MLYSSYTYNATGLAHVVCSNCSNGFTPPQGSPGCPFQRGTPADMGHQMEQMVAISQSPAGPWKRFEVKGLTMGWDWNTAITINDDGSAVGLIRGGMVWYASNYADNSTWHPVGNPAGQFSPQSPQWDTPGGVEDPYIWRDGRGVYHALAHAFTPFYGAHGYVRPEDVPTNWSDPSTPMKWTISGGAYSNNVSFTDGSSYAFSRRERPHLVWAAGQQGKVPVALTNGVEYGAHANTANQDATFTLSQPIKQA